MTGLAVLLAASAAGCAAGTDPGRPPALGAVPAQSDPAAFPPLPIAAYLAPSSTDSIMSRAYVIATNSCLGRFGFPPRPIPPYTPGDPRMEDADTWIRYGFTDPARAALRGFHRLDADQPTAPTPQDSYPGGDDPAYSLVMTGTTTTGDAAAATSPSTASTAPVVVHGIAVPPGGCRREVQDAMARKSLKMYDQIAIDIQHTDFLRSKADPRVRAVLVDWSACMKAKGYAYPDPIAAAADERWNLSQPPTQPEKEVATAAAQCSVQGKVANTWYAVEVAYEKQDIDKNKEVLDAADADYAAQLKAATAIVRNAGLNPDGPG
jgi:hypothetical protein